MPKFITDLTKKVVHIKPPSQRFAVPLQKRATSYLCKRDTPALTLTGKQFTLLSENSEFSQVQPMTQKTKQTKFRLDSSPGKRPSSGGTTTLLTRAGSMSRKTQASQLAFGQQKAILTSDVPSKSTQRPKSALFSGGYSRAARGTQSFIPQNIGNMFQKSRHTRQITTESGQNLKQHMVTVQLGTVSSTRNYNQSMLSTSQKKGFGLF